VETHTQYGVEKRGQIVAPGRLSRSLRPLVVGVRRWIPDQWMRDYVYGPLSSQARARYERNWPFLLPATVSIETRTICNGRCSFCAASVQNRTRPDATMSWAVFAGIIDELMKVNYAGRVAFFVNNEPLLDKGLEKKVAHARERLPRAFLQVSTNGLVLTPERAGALFDAGLDDLTVNDYTDHHDVRENIEATFNALAPERRRKFIVYVREQEAELFNRAGSAPNKQVAPRPMPAFCQMPFTQINIVHDGTVSLCCQDLLVQEPIGNAHTDGLWNVWFSPRYHEIRTKLLAKDRTATDLCAVCDYRGFKTLTGPLRPLNRLFNVLK
jgi:MoaA/NifB/PqqE/SkfB family radical SAM enzyme